MASNNLKIAGGQGIAVDLIIKTVAQITSIFQQLQKKIIINHPSVTVFVVLQYHFRESVVICVRYNEIFPHRS